MRLLADCIEHTLEIECPDDTDLDSRFAATDLDTGDTIRINGWLWTFEPLENRNN